LDACTAVLLLLILLRGLRRRKWTLRRRWRYWLSLHHPLGIMLYIHDLASRMCKHHLCWWVQLAIGMEEGRLHWRSLGWVSYLLLLSKRTNNLLLRMSWNLHTRLAW
jgi:hypothetical protein